MTYDFTCTDSAVYLDQRPLHDLAWAATYLDCWLLVVVWAHSLTFQCSALQGLPTSPAPLPVLARKTVFYLTPIPTLA